MAAWTPSPSLLYSVAPTTTAAVHHSSVAERTSNIISTSAVVASHLRLPIMSNPLPNPAAPILHSPTTSLPTPTPTDSFPPFHSTLSSRGQRACQPISSYWRHFLTASSTPYTPSSPNGHILLCVAENKLNMPAWLDRISRCRQLDETVGAYADMRGLLPLREQLARLMSRRLSIDRPLTLPPSSILLANGVGSALSTLTLLLCEPGDAVLIPSPAYAAFPNDLSFSALATPVWVRTDSTSYRLHVPAFQAALEAFDADAQLNWEAHPLIDEGHFGGYERVGDEGVTCEAEDVESRVGYNKALEAMQRRARRVRVVLLTNPHNPLGLVYERGEVEAVVRWAVGRGLHVVVDEIYAHSVYNPLPPPQFVEGPGVGGRGAGERGAFRTALEWVDEGGKGGGLGEGGLVHVVQGLSKDFGLSGYRVGWVVTRNSAVIEAWGNAGYFTSVSNDVQQALALVLKDEVWVDEFLYANAQLLKTAYETVVAVFDGAHEAVVKTDDKDEVVDDPTFTVTYLPAVAGMFVWVDLRAFLTPPKEVGKNEWAQEERLFEYLLQEAKVMLTPGHAQGASEPGFFRLCFAWVPNDALVVGCVRLRRALFKRRAQMQ